MPTTIVVKGGESTEAPSVASSTRSTGGSKPQPQQQLECDYDTSPTELYQAIEAKQWKYVAKIFEQNPTAKQQAATWVLRKEANGKLRWRLLPLHAAVIFQAPQDVIELLLQENPQAATAKDDQGMLPLHLALRSRPPSFEVIEELLTANPASVFVKDRKGRTPLQGGQAAVADGDSMYKSVMATLEMYTQIVTAGERQRWLAEQKQASDQRLAATQEQHIQRLTALKHEFEKEYRGLEDNHKKELKSMRGQVEVAKDREELLRQQVVDLKQQLGGIISDSQEQENRELRQMVKRLLEQNQSLVASLDKQAREHDAETEKRNALLAELNKLDEEAAEKTQASIAVWKESLNEIEAKMTKRLNKLDSTPLRGASPVGDEKKEEDEPVPIVHAVSPTPVEGDNNDEAMRIATTRSMEQAS